MEQKRCGVGGAWCKFKAHLMMLIQLGYSILYFFAEASFIHGFNPYVFVTYRSTVAGLAMLPFPYFLRVEIINPRNPRSIAKIVGTLVFLGGVMIVTLYRGPIISNVWPPLIHIHKNDRIHEDWLKGSLLVISSCVAWAIWYIMQMLLMISIYMHLVALYRGPIIRNVWPPLIHIHN